MELLLVKIATALVLPPGGNFALTIAGVALWQRRRVLAVILLTIAFVTLYVFSTPKLSDVLFEAVESVDARLPGAAPDLRPGRSTKQRPKLQPLRPTKTICCGTWICFRPAFFPPALVQQSR